MLILHYSVNRKWYSMVDMLPFSQKESIIIIYCNISANNSLPFLVTDYFIPPHRKQGSKDFTLLILHYLLLIGIYASHYGHTYLLYLVLSVSCLRIIWRIFSSCICWQYVLIYQICVRTTIIYWWIKHVKILKFLTFRVGQHRSLVFNNFTNIRCV